MYLKAVDKLMKVKAKFHFYGENPTQGKTPKIPYYESKFVNTKP